MSQRAMGRGNTADILMHYGSRKLPDDTTGCYVGWCKSRVKEPYPTHSVFSSQTFFISPTNVSTSRLLRCLAIHAIIVMQKGMG